MRKSQLPDISPLTPVDDACWDFPFNPQPDGGYPGCDNCTCKKGFCAANAELLGSKPTGGQLKVLLMLRDGKQPKFHQFFGGGAYSRGNVNKGVFSRCIDAGWIKYEMPKPGELNLLGKPKLSGRYVLTRLGQWHLPPSSQGQSG